MKITNFLKLGAFILFAFFSKAMCSQSSYIVTNNGGCVITVDLVFYDCSTPPSQCQIVGPFTIPPMSSVHITPPGCAPNYCDVKVTLDYIDTAPIGTSVDSANPFMPISLPSPPPPCATGSSDTMIWHSGDTDIHY